MTLPTWPPTLADVKTDLGIDESDTRDNTRLTMVLDAAVSFVERVHQRRYNFAGDELSSLPGPPGEFGLGVIRLAGRWHTRRRSPDGLVQMAELGAARVSTGDPDIDRMLRIGRHSPPVIA